MRTTAFIALAAAELVAGHATFQFIAKNGGAQTDTGVRGTSDQNNPILSTAAALSSDLMICKGGAAITGEQFEVAGGDKLALQWHHNTGTTGAGDADEPIAESHHGPIMVYITPAATKGESGWVKIYEDGLTGTQWAVDKFRANKGIIDVTLPDLAKGDYLIRPEIIALHEGNRAGGAQFYNGCGQITVTSSGSVTLPAGVDLRTAYKADDAGVLFDIYAGKTSYPIPGPALFKAGSAGSPAAPSSTKVAAPSPTKAAPTAAPPAATTTKAATTTAAPAPAPTTTKAAVPTTLVTSKKPAATGNPSVTVKKYYQCGGISFTGATQCETGTTCKKQNDWYSQCL